MGSGISEQYTLSNLIENRETRLNELSNNEYIGKSNASKDYSLYENSKELIKKYGLDEFGRFGEEGKNCRIIKSKTPLQEADGFFEAISRGARIEPLGDNPYGKVATLLDNSEVSFRTITKTPNSPAVEIIISNSEKIAAQKIHFIMR